MRKTKFDNNDVMRLASLLKESRRIVVTCHLSPDGDALGSSLGLKRFLSCFNPTAKVTVVTPDEPTRTLSFLPGFREILPFSRCASKTERTIAEADLLVCLDFNVLQRTDLLAPALEKCKATKILIDHHLSPDDFATLKFSYPEKCATCMLLFELIEAAGLEKFVDSKTATCILAGMMTDTGDFSYNVSDPEIYNVIARLIALGANKGWLTRLLFNTFSESNLRIQGFALAEKMEVFHEMHAALVTLSREDLNRFSYQKGDTEGLVNKPMAIPGILYSCYLRQETDYIKVSMRSLGDFPVNRICEEYFGGGGHLNAAGGEFYGTMDECVSLFKKILNDNYEKYIATSSVLTSILKEELRQK